MKFIHFLRELKICNGTFGISLKLYFYLHPKKLPANCSSAKKEKYVV